MYDYPDYNSSYDKAFYGIRAMLKKYPSIQIVLDIHRGSMYQKDGSRIKPVTKIGDKKIAQIQIVTGCEDGNVTDFPYWEKNLTFALNLQKKLADNNPTLVFVNELKTVISEIITNSIVHGYVDTVGMIEINCEIYNNYIKTKK